jgi:hypothetical protein
MLKATNFNMLYFNARAILERERESVREREIGRKSDG